MNASISLDNYYLQYVAGTLPKKELEGLVFKSIQQAPHQFGLRRWKKYDIDEYLSWLYPRISKAIDSYRDRGLSFDSYVVGLTRLASKEFRSRRADSHIAERAAWIAWYSYERTQEPEVEYSEEKKPAALPDGLSNTPRQMLILILKCYRYISDDFLARVAPMTGTKTDALKETIAWIQELRSRRDADIVLMRERVYGQFYRCFVYEKRLAAMPEGSAIFDRMKIRLEKARQRLARMRQRLAGMRLDPSNAQIANILGVTKGTVDSSLHAMRNRWNNVPKKPILD